jgi:predicted metal-dependent HD superfamily phosphohydrolase
MPRESLLLELTALYSQPDRHYHDLRHVADLLLWGRAFPLDEIQTWAIWFHDAIYDASRRDNEEQSAQLAEARLPALGYDESFVGEVAQIIRDTASHVATIPRAEAVLDLDLAPLAIPEERFLANRERIRKEYAFASDEEFVAGTAAFAQRILEREHIFHTPWGRAREPQARDNLRLLVDAAP